MNKINRQWLLKKRPSGMVTINDFEYHEGPLPQPNKELGEVLVKNICLSFDPAMRGWMDDAPSYLPPVGLGEPMRASSVGQVVESDNPELPVGTLVQGMYGWQEYAVASAGDLVAPRPIPEGVPHSMVLSVFGGTSLTAYFGLLDVGQPQSGDTVLVSGAAGATGSVVAQIARIKGCRVIAIAGGKTKCDWLKDECLVNEVIDYKNEDVATRLAELCPEGIKVFFDNAGGYILRDTLEHMADHGRVVMCGQIADYNSSSASAPLDNMFHIITKRLCLQGFIMLDYIDRAEEAFAELTDWIMSGDIKWQEDMQHGFENIPATFLRLFNGENNGKQMLQLAEPAG
jgi:NADPH-dependent curcumin reductase CurA